MVALFNEVQAFDKVLVRIRRMELHDLYSIRAIVGQGGCDCLCQPRLARAGRSRKNDLLAAIESFNDLHELVLRPVCRRNEPL